MSDSYKLWFEKAKENLKWAEDNLRGDNFPLVCYLSQQSAELVLKGFLYFKNTIPPKTHQLVRLEEECRRAGLNVQVLQESLAVLTEYYLESRYPDELSGDLDNKEIASQALVYAKEVFEEVSSELRKLL